MRATSTLPPLPLLPPPWAVAGRHVRPHGQQQQRQLALSLGPPRAWVGA